MKPSYLTRNSSWRLSWREKNRHSGQSLRINTFKYHVLCTNGKISISINLLFYLYFPPSFHLTVLCFCPVDLSLLIQHFQQVLWVLKLFLSPALGSWQLEFKSLIIVIVGFFKFQIISDLNSNRQLPKPGDRSDFNTHKTCWKCCYSKKRPTGQKHKYTSWDDGGK